MLCLLPGGCLYSDADSRQESGQPLLERLTFHVPAFVTRLAKAVAE